MPPTGTNDGAQLGGSGGSRGEALGSSETAASSCIRTDVGAGSCSVGVGARLTGVGDPGCSKTDGVPPGGSGAVEAVSKMAPPAARTPSAEARTGGPWREVHEETKECSAAAAMQGRAKVMLIFSAVIRLCCS